MTVTPYDGSPIEIRPTKYARFIPVADITALELALVIQQLSLTVDEPLYNKMPELMRRHFSLSD